MNTFYHHYKNYTFDHMVKLAGVEWNTRRRKWRAGVILYSIFKRAESLQKSWVFHILRREHSWQCFILWFGFGWELQHDYWLRNDDSDVLEEVKK